MTDEISLQDAAILLNKSKPTVMRLIERGHLESRRVGTHHKLVRVDVLEYKDVSKRICRINLDKLAELTQEWELNVQQNAAEGKLTREMLAFRDETVANSEQAYCEQLHREAHEEFRSLLQGRPTYLERLANRRAKHN